MWRFFLFWLLPAAMTAPSHSDNYVTVAAKLTVNIEDSEETSITNNVFDGTGGKFS